MSVMTVDYSFKKHATCELTGVISAKGGKNTGHSFSIELTNDTDNGALIALGDYKSLDLFGEKAATTFEGVILDTINDGEYLVQVTNPGDALLVRKAPIAAEEYNETFKDDSHFYNKAGDVVPAFTLVKYDTFSLSEEGFDGTPVKGKKITGVNNKKLTVDPS